MPLTDTRRQAPRPTYAILSWYAVGIPQHAANRLIPNNPQIFTRGFYYGIRK
jgi:hypothetical protein